MMTERERAHPSFHDLTSAKQRLDDRNDDHSNTRKAILKTIIHQYIMTDVLCFDFGMLCKELNVNRYYFHFYLVREEHYKIDEETLVKLSTYSNFKNSYLLSPIIKMFKVELI